MNSPRLLLAVLLLVSHASWLPAAELSPIELVRRFQLALALKDEPTLRRLALPDPDLPALWEGDKPAVELLNRLCMSLDKVVIQEVQPTGKGPERDIVRVQRAVRGRLEPPLAVLRVQGRWRLDARPFVLMALRRLERSPQANVGKAWEELFALDQFLASSPGLWGARLSDLVQTPHAPSFRTDTGEAPRAVYQAAEGRPAPALFGRPVQALELAFQNDFLAGVTATFYEAKTAPAALSSAQTQQLLGNLDRALRRLAKDNGRSRKARRDPNNRAQTIRARQWQLPGTTVRLEAIAANQSSRDPETGATSSRKRTVAVRVRASRRAETGDRDQSAKGSLGKEAREALGMLGTDVSPAVSAFWQQTKLGFLGSFAARCHAHWTPEQETAAGASFRSCYVQRPHQEIRDEKPVMFVRNEPLAASQVALFGRPVVAMVASFHQDRLVAFHFDFWNKGDGVVKGSETGVKGVTEEMGEKAFKSVLTRLRKAGLEFQRKAGSQGKISRVRDVRYIAKAGPTTVTLILQKGEYYSLLLEGSRHLASRSEEPKERASGRELRNTAKEGVIRITTDAEAAKYPGTVKVGDVFVQVPMVDQGPKGYCAPATVTRVVQYYGNETTMNEMAAMMGTQDGGGTRLTDIRDGVRKVTRRLRMSFKEEDVPDKKRLDSQRRVDRWMAKAVVDYIDSGNPIFWTIPDHIRLIVGYNARTREVLYSDSWGRKGYDRLPYQEAASKTEVIWIIR